MRVNNTSSKPEQFSVFRYRLKDDDRWHTVIGPPQTKSEMRVFLDRHYPQRLQEIEEGSS